MHHDPMRILLPLVALSCTADPCPAGSARKEDGLCHLVEGTPPDANAPTLIDSGDPPPDSGDPMTGYSMLSVGGSTVCAIRTVDQGIDCQLLGASHLADFGQATPPEGRFSAVSVGALHACALSTDGTATCWGQPDETDQGKLALSGGSYLGITAGLTTSCAWTEDHVLSCVSDATDESDLTRETDVRAADAGPRNTLRLRTDGRIVVDPDGEHFAQSTRFDEPFSTAAMGGTFTCGLTESGSIHCAGDDFHGQLQAPNGVFSTIDAGVVHACALAADGTATCWGNDAYGQAQPPTEPLTAISTGADVSCGLDTNGALRCWGAIEPPLEPDADARLSHAAHIQPIWDAHCIHCHNGWESGRLNLVGAAGYGAMTGVTWRQLAEPGEPERSVLMGRINGTGGPRMPPGYALDPVLQSRIEAWITAGAAP